jgi:hypothetical protein
MAGGEKAAYTRTTEVPVSLYHDQVAEIAKGGEVENLPRGYYLRPDFVGTLTVCAVACCPLGGVLMRFPRQRVAHRSWRT